MVNAMLINIVCPITCGGGEAILVANYVLNKVPHKKLCNTPNEMWKSYVPNLKHLIVWRCLAKVGIPSFKRETIGPKAYDTIFFGYVENSVLQIHVFK